tara:strand:+ start:7777 stop:8145 length:369 start_codon:yes stop_codon:yes gene_type:complete
MFQRKQRRFRRRLNGRKHSPHNNGGVSRLNSFTNGHIRNNFRSTQSPEKLFEKYNNLAKEAISSGDKTLSENYLQHADHFMRIIEDRNRNREQIKTDAANIPQEDKKVLDDTKIIQQDETKK